MFANDEELETFLRERDNLDDIKKRVLIAYEKTGLNITAACQAAHVHRANFYYWLSKDWVFKKEVELMSEMIGDLCEAKAMEQINGKYVPYYEQDGVTVKRDGQGNILYSDVYAVPPNTTMIIFMLKTKFKDRGYVEKKESDAPPVMPVIIDWRQGLLPEVSTKQNT